MFFGHGVARYLTGSVRFTCGYPWDPRGFVDCGNRTVPCGCRAGLEIPVRSVMQGLKGSGEARECTLVLLAHLSRRLTGELIE